MYSNANGIFNKLDELKIFLDTHQNVEFVFITETHLNKDILDAELQIDGYSFIRNDRNFQIEISDSDQSMSAGGGSMIYYKNNIGVYIRQ